MKRRKIIEQNNVDYETGEILSSKTTYVSKNEETFTMLRTTEGLEWARKLNSAVDWQMLVILSDKSDREGRIILTAPQRTEICAFYNITDKTFYNAITRLIQANFIKRISPMNYLINPEYFFKGSSTTLKQRISIYKGEPL